MSLLSLSSLSPQKNFTDSLSYFMLGFSSMNLRVKMKFNDFWGHGPFHMNSIIQKIYFINLTLTRNLIPKLTKLKFYTVPFLLKHSTKKVHKSWYLSVLSHIAHTCENPPYSRNRAHQKLKTSLSFNIKNNIFFLLSLVFI